MITLILHSQYQCMGSMLISVSVLVSLYKVNVILSHNSLLSVSVTSHQRELPWSVTCCEEVVHTDWVLGYDAGVLLQMASAWRWKRRNLNQVWFKTRLVTCRSKDEIKSQSLRLWKQLQSWQRVYPLSNMKRRNVYLKASILVFFSLQKMTK